MEPKDLVRRFVDEYQTGGDERALDELVHPDVLDHSRPPGVAPGAEGIRQQVNGVRGMLYMSSRTINGSPTLISAMQTVENC